MPYFLSSNYAVCQYIYNLHTSTKRYSHILVWMLYVIIVYREEKYKIYFLIVLNCYCHCLASFYFYYTSVAAVAAVIFYWLNNQYRVIIHRLSAVFLENERNGETRGFYIYFYSFFFFFYIALLLLYFLKHHRHIYTNLPIHYIHTNTL